jgi:hypothetical protein
VSMPVELSGPLQLRVPLRALLKVLLSFEMSRPLDVPLRLGMLMSVEVALRLEVPVALAMPLSAGQRTTGEHVGNTEQHEQHAQLAQFHDAHSVERGGQIETAFPPSWFRLPYALCGNHGPATSHSAVKSSIRQMRRACVFPAGDARARRFDKNAQFALGVLLLRLLRRWEAG